MQKVSVKAVHGRVAFTAPRGGARIPHDKFIRVTRTPWIERLLEVHGDIIEEPADKKKTKPKTDTENGNSVL